MLPPVAEIAHTLSPRLVTAGLEMRAHDCLDLVRRHVMLRRNHIEGDMVRQRHFDNLAYLDWGEGGGSRCHSGQ